MHHAIRERLSSTQPLWPCGSIHPALLNINKWHLWQTRFSWWVDVNWNIEWLCLYFLQESLHISAVFMQRLSRVCIFSHLPAAYCGRLYCSKTLEWPHCSEGWVESRWCTADLYRRGEVMLLQLAHRKGSVFFRVFVFSALCILVSDNIQDLPPRLTASNKTNEGWIDKYWESIGKTQPTLGAQSLSSSRLSCCPPWPIYFTENNSVSSWFTICLPLLPKKRSVWTFSELTSR